MENEDYKHFVAKLSWCIISHKRRVYKVITLIALNER